MPRLPVHLVAFTFLLLLVPSAWAQVITCSLSQQDISLGQQPSFNLNSSTSSRGQSALTCGLLTLGTNSMTRVVFENVPLQLQNTSDSAETLPLVLRVGTANGDVLSNNYQVNSNATQWLSNSPGLIPIFASLGNVTGLNPKAGTYTATIQLRWYWNVCTNGVLVLCLTWSSSPGINPTACSWTSCNWGTGVATTLQVSVTVTNDCIITAPNISFGSAPLISGFRPVVQNISVRCTRGSLYQVGLSDGAYSSGGIRRMRGASQLQYLSYEIYRSATSLDRWGNSAAQTRSSTSADINPTVTGYNVNTAQQFTYRAEILGTQTPPAADTYSDSIILNVTF